MPPPGGKNKEAEQNFANFMTSTAGGTTSPSTGGIGPAGMGGASFTPQSDPTGPGFTTPSDTTIPPQDNNNNNQTGSGASGGTGSSQGAAGSGITNLAGITAAQKFLGTRQPGLDGLIQDNLETYGLTGKQNINDLETIEVDQPSENWRDKFQLLGGDNSQGFQYNLTDPGKLGYNINENMGFTADIDPFKGTGNFGFKATFNDGGPVGIMSLPEGHAAGGPVGVDPSDWRIIQQIIAAGGNPEDYVNYADGGQVMPATSYIDPTADDYFLRELGQYMKRFMPGYDKEADEYRQEKNREKMKSLEDKMSRMKAANGGPMTAETPMERKPFGGTRENVMDQIEAFDNAPVHMEEPMVGMYGEKVPLTLARRVQKYMEGLDPVKRNMIQETLNMFQMKKRMQEMEELNENSGFFGTIPNEYEA